MSQSSELIERFETGKMDQILIKLYGTADVEIQRSRYIKAVESFVEHFGERDNLYIFSAPGRTEIGGNHTDHNYGKVLAASVNLDAIAIVAANNSGIINVKSEGYGEDSVHIKDLEVKESEKNRSVSLIRGVAAKIKERGYNIGGFEAYITSDVPTGCGISSSAAFEVLIGTILSHIYNDGQIDAFEIAKAAQCAESEYFGKPCGLMDQMASSVGGVIKVDFKDPQNPNLEPVVFDFSKFGYSLFIVDTGGSHEDLTAEYAAIHEEMKQVASCFGKTVLREVNKDDFLLNLKNIRGKLGERAILRALHYFDENNRVDKQTEALKNFDFDAFNKLVIESGNSSYKYLQNVFSQTDPKSQGLSLALYIAESLLKQSGSYRVHGGGFAGTTQNFVPAGIADKFKSRIESVFGAGSCIELLIRPVGAIKIL